VSRPARKQPAADDAPAELVPLQLYSVDEVAALLRYSRRSVYNLIEAGELATINHSSRAMRIPAHEIVAYQQRHLVRRSAKQADAQA
jgi:excisionase family DNA binding protein